MHILYCSLFLPHLTHCVEIWGNTYPTNVDGIVLLQKRIIRIMCSANRLDPANSLFEQLPVLKCLDIIKLQTDLFICKGCYSYLSSNIQCVC